MRTFKDNAGREWKIELTIGAAMRVRDQVGVDLLEIDQGDPPLLSRLGTESSLLASVIAEILRPQFEKENVTAEDVMETFTADVLVASAQAFFEDLVDFFRKSGREDKAVAIEKQNKIVAAGVKLAAAGINEIDEEQLVGDLLGSVQERAIHGGNSGASPEQSP